METKSDSENNILESEFQIAELDTGIDPDEEDSEGGHHHHHHHHSHKHSHHHHHHHHHKSNSENKKKKTRAWLVVVIVIVVLLGAGAALFGTVGIKYIRAQVDDLQSQAYVLKDNITEVFENITESDFDGARDSLDDMQETSDGIEDALNGRFWQAVYFFDKYKSDIDTVKLLIKTLEDASDDVIEPLIDQLEDHPFSDIKVDGGLDVNQILSYLDFVDEMVPEIEKVTDTIKTVRFENVALDVSAYSDKLTELTEKFELFRENEDFLRALFGDGEDKCYLALAQNTAEIRASGGFPGSTGTITIKDGILQMGHFSSDTYIAWLSPYDVGKTDEEYVLFGNDYFYQDRDADYNPHWAKVASITQLSSENYKGIHGDGVIGMTPHIIQEILAVTGDTITLSDGTTMDGTNATKVIDRDLYMKYLSDADVVNTNEPIVNDLFSETADKAFASFMDKFSLDNLESYVEMFRKCFEKRYLMMWFEDEEAEEAVKAAGASGNLNFDENNPVAGIYLSVRDASRLGMFIAIDYEVSEPTMNDDGCNEYTVTATFTNYMNEYDLSNVTATTYIMGHHDGAINSYVHLFAPAGGTVSNFKTNYGIDVTKSTYENLQVGYWHEVLIYQDNPLVVTYKVTTAKGVETPLKIESTPTLQDAR